MYLKDMDGVSDPSRESVDVYPLENRMIESIVHCQKMEPYFASLCFIFFTEIP